MRIAWVCGIILGFLHGAIPAVSLAQEVFLPQLLMPNGITSDANGNIDVHSDDLNTTLLTKFSPNGNPIDQTTIGADSIEALSFVGSRLATDAVMDLLYLMSRNGIVIILASSTLDNIENFDIRDLNINTTNVFDIATGQSSGLNLSQSTIYGDIAVFHPQNGQAALFVTGLSGTTPFVLRIPLQQPITQAEVVLMSTHPSPTTLAVPPGIAVNGAGDVLTTLPAPASIPSCPDVLVTFTAGAPAATVMPLFPGISSSGMGTDDRDNFYIAAGGHGNPSCISSGEGVLIFLTAALDNPVVNSLGSFSITPQDVAVSSQDGRVYLTVEGDISAVIRFPTLASLTHSP